MEPKIRLKGFSGEWKTAKIGTVAPITGGYAFQSNCFVNNGVPIVRISNILDSGVVGGDFAFYDFFPGDEQFKLHKDDIVIAMSGATTGKVAIIKDDKTYYQNQRVGKFSKTGKVDYSYLSTIVGSDKFLRELYRLLTASAQPNASSKDIDSISITLPEYKNEQEAIALYFSNLDSLIQSTTKKIESLKQVKAASLQSMFPQEGETKPRVRFKGFESDWDMKKFSELYEPSSIKNKIFGADKIISVANMYFKPTSYISNEDYLKSYNVMSIGDIAFEGNKSKDFAHGRFVENTIGDGIVSHVFVVLKPISVQYDLQFWKYLINYERIMGPILLRSTKHSTMMTDLVVADFLKESILVPSYEEQKAIGNFLKNLDTQITLQTQRLEKLKQIKSACLDNMFV